MIVTFEPKDRDRVRRCLNDMGLVVNQNKHIDDVLYNVEAAFQQQLGDEIGHMINVFEVDS